MKRFVVDASVAVKWFIPEEDSSHAAKLLSDSFQLIAPDLIFLELGSVVWQRVRTKRMSPVEAQNVLKGLGAMSLDITPVLTLIPLALDVAITTSRSIYDSTYLALAVRSKCHLVTADRKLYNALEKTEFATSLILLEKVPLT